MNTMAEHNNPTKIDVFPISGSAYYRTFMPRDPLINSIFPHTGEPALRARKPDQDEIPPITTTVTTGTEVNAKTMLLDTEVKDLGREQRLSRFISNLRDQKEISGETALRVWETWKRLREATGRMLRVPDASAGPDDGFMFIWNKGEHHLELEIFPDGTMEFFYRNRVSGSLWGEDYNIGETFTQEVLDRLTVFS